MISIQNKEVHFFVTIVVSIHTSAAFSLYLSVYTSGNPSDKTASQRDCSQLWWCWAGWAAVIIVATAAFSLYLSVYTSGNPSDKTASQRDCGRLWWCLEGLAAFITVATAALFVLVCRNLWKPFGTDGITKGLQLVCPKEMRCVNSIKPTTTGICPKKRPFSRGYTSLQLAVCSPESER